MSFLSPPVALAEANTNAGEANPETRPAGLTDDLYDEQQFQETLARWSRGYKMVRRRKPEAGSSPKATLGRVRSMGRLFVEGAGWLAAETMPGAGVAMGERADSLREAPRPAEDPYGPGQFVPALQDLPPPEEN